MFLFLLFSCCKLFSPCAREGPRTPQVMVLVGLWAGAALLALERLAGLAGRVGLVEEVVRVRS